MPDYAEFLTLRLSQPPNYPDLQIDTQVVEVWKTVDKLIQIWVSKLPDTGKATKARPLVNVEK